MPHVSVQKISKRFQTAGGAITALKDVSFDVPRRTLVALIGANGAGKTTLMKVLAGRLLADSGKIRVNGRLTATSERSWASRVGFAEGEAVGFYDRLTGRQNLAFFAALYGLDASAAERRIDLWIERLLLPQPDAPWQSLSAGGRARWILARAMLHGPGLLLLDEPTRSQDPDGVRVVHRVLHALRQNASTTIFLATHRREDLALADTVIWLQHGAVACTKSPQALLSDKAFSDWWADASKKKAGDS